jgi:hypothetical protein
MKFTCTFLLLILSYSVFAQQRVDVTEQTIKIGGMKEEEIYFGFAEGDQIVFNFAEVDKKDLKEIEIIQYPNNSKFSDYKTNRIDEKFLNVSEKSVYIFRFKNSSISGRVCKIKIQRIPAGDATKLFNSTVTWTTKQETTYNTYTKDVIAGYDTVYQQKVRKKLVSSVQTEEMIMDKSQRVHSTTNSNGNKTFIHFSLPDNQLYGGQTKRVVAWAYWIGVGEDANKVWQQNAKIISGIVKTSAKLFTSPLGAFAIGAVTDLAIPKIGEDVTYALSNATNKDLYMAGLPCKVFDQGKGVAGYSKFLDAGMLQGTYYILLSNDNIMHGVDATVKVVAIVETNTYEDEPYTEMKVNPRYEKKTFSDPVLKTVKFPVTG